MSSGHDHPGVTVNPYKPVDAVYQYNQTQLLKDRNIKIAADRVKLTLEKEIEIKKLALKQTESEKAAKEIVECKKKCETPLEGGKRRTRTRGKKSRRSNKKRKGKKSKRTRKYK